MYSQLTVRMGIVSILVYSVLCLRVSVSLILARWPCKVEMHVQHVLLLGSCFLVVCTSLVLQQFSLAGQAVFVFTMLSARGTFTKRSYNVILLVVVLISIMATQILLSFGS